MKRSKTSARFPFASIIALATCALARAATGEDGVANKTPFDGACVAATVSELEVSSDGEAKGSLSVRNGCRTSVMLLLSPVRVDFVRRGQRIPWMGAENGRNAFVRMLLLQDGVEIDSVFAGDAAQNVYAPLKAVRLDAGAEESIPIAGSLPSGQSLETMAKGQLLLPCFPATPAVSKTTALDPGSLVGKPSQTAEEQPKRLPDAAALVHTAPFPIRIGSTK